MTPPAHKTGKSADPALGYDWAIVTAGAPSHRTLAGKCRTGDALGNNQGTQVNFTNIRRGGVG